MYSPELDIICAKRLKAEKLRGLSSQQIEDTAKKYMEKYGSKKIDVHRMQIFPETHPSITLAAAMDVLRERHGPDYVARITGLRQPKTMGEKIRHFLTGNLPRVEPGHQYLLFS